VTEKLRTSPEGARRVGNAIGVDWSLFEFSDYYRRQRLERMEHETERDWADEHS
jgi:hypothetical protein